MSGGAARTTKAAQPVPASIPLPDSPIRGRGWYQVYSRLARPTLDWIGCAGAAWSLFVGDWLGMPMDEGTRVIVLTFVSALYGIRTFEKTKGRSMTKILGWFSGLDIQGKIGVFFLGLGLVAIAIVTAVHFIDAAFENTEQKGAVTERAATQGKVLENVEKPTPRKIAIATSLALLTLTACSTLRTPPSASDSFCLIAKRLTYTLVPRSEREAAAAESRPVEDDGNKADSAATIEQIGIHNAKYREVCPAPDTG